MKKTCLLMIAGVLVAGAGRAQTDPGCPQQPNWSKNREARRAAEARFDWHGQRHPPGPMSPEMMEQMRMEHRAIRALGDAARAETNETRKAELVGQLRDKLNEIADRMQKHQEERLAHAEARLAAIKERLEAARANREQWIEEQIRRILSGERPPLPPVFKQFPFAKGSLEEKGDEGRPEWRQGPHGRRSWEAVPPPPPPEDLPPPGAE